MSDIYTPYIQGSNHTPIPVNNGCSEIDEYATQGSSNAARSGDLYDKYTETVTDLKGQNSLLKSTVGWTGKNKWKPVNMAGSSNKGISYVKNSNGSVTFDGTATGDFFFPAEPSAYQSQDFYHLEGGKSYVLSTGVPNSSIVFQAYCKETSQSSWIKMAQDVLSGNEMTLTMPNTYYAVWIRFTIRTGSSLSNVTVYPLLRPADITDPTYEPYHESVEVMHEEDIYGVNLFKVTATTSTIGGVTYTVNSDLSVFTSGLTPSGSTSQLELGSVTLAAGTYRGSGCASGGSYSPWTYQMHFRKNNASGELIARDTGDGCVFTLSETTVVNVKITVNESIDMSGKKFYPMIYDASLGSNLPYCKFNEQSIQNQLNNITGELTVRNKLEITANTQTINGVTFTVNRDSKGNVTDITANGTATSQANLYIGTTSNLRPSNIYKLNGCPGGGSLYSYHIIIKRFEYNNPCDIGEGLDFSVESSDAYHDVYIRIQSGTTVSNLVFKPMIKLASDPDPTYVPYAMTNRELTEMKLDVNTVNNWTTSCSFDIPDNGGVLVMTTGGGSNECGGIFWLYKFINSGISKNGTIPSGITITRSGNTITLTSEATFVCRIIRI